MKTEITFAQHEKEFRQFLEKGGVADPRGIELSRALIGVARMLEVIADQHLQTRDLSLPRLRLLLWLHAEEARGNKAGLSPSHLSQFQHISKNTVSSLLDSLEKQGLIERTLNREDKRKFNIRITRAGRELIGKTLPAYSAHIAETFAELSAEEQKTLIRLLQKLRGSLKTKLMERGFGSTKPHISRD